jgi:hypothetical protein
MFVAKKFEHNELKTIMQLPRSRFYIDMGWRLSRHWFDEHQPSETKNRVCRVNKHFPVFVSLHFALQHIFNFQTTYMEILLFQLLYISKLILFFRVCLRYSLFEFKSSFCLFSIVFARLTLIRCNPKDNIRVKLLLSLIR